MTTKDALLTAIELIYRTGNPDAELVIKHLEAMLAQKGCEVHDPAVKDGKLTTLCDVVMFG